MKKTVLLTALLCALALGQITKKDLMKTDAFLASQKLAGRLAGSPGYLAAAKFITGELTKIKLRPAGNNGFYQKCKIEYNEILAPEHFNTIVNRKTIRYKLGVDYVYRGFTGAGKINAPVVFCGYGVSQPQDGYDDYAGIDVKDKIVIVFKPNPRWNKNGKTLLNGNPREKAITASKHGAVGMLLVSPPNDPEPQKPIGSVLSGEGEQMLNFPELHISLKAAGDLFDGCSYTLKQAQTIIDSTRNPMSLPLNNRADIEVNTKYVKQKDSYNIIAKLEGGSPALKDECVIISAHLDHVGSQAGKIYFPGANDNASGSSAVLQIAREFARQKDKPARSVYFVFFTSEEAGLLGAQYLADHLPFPKEKIKCLLNMDCIAFGDSIQFGGGEDNRRYWNLAKSIDSCGARLMVNATWKGGGADAEPFYKIGIPTLYVVTTNSYKHLHLPSDRPETLNQSLFEEITKLTYKTARAIANE